VKQFDEAIEKLNDVKRDKEKLFLLEIGLPDMLAVILESRYLVATFQRKITELVQKALTFALDGLDLSLNGSCKLINELFGHPHFSEVSTQLLGADALAPGSPSPISSSIISAELSVAASAGGVGASAAAPSSSSSSAPALSAVTSSRDSASSGGFSSSREHLTQSKRIRSFGRLYEILATFSEQKGYDQLLFYLSRSHRPIQETRSLLQLILTMVSYLNTPVAKLIQFVRESYSRLTEHVSSLAPLEAPIYEDVKKLTRQLLDMMSVADAGVTHELWRMSIVSKLAREMPPTLPILYMQYPEKSSRVISLDSTKLQSIKDARTEFCLQAKVDPEEIAFKSVMNGQIVKSHDDSHALTTMFAQQSYNVAYHMPAGWKRKYVQLLIVEGKSNPDFIPFYIYVRRKDLTGKHLYESLIPSSFLFTVKSMSEAPFALKATRANSSSTSNTNTTNTNNTIDVHNSNSKIFSDVSKGDSIVIRVDWSESAESSPLQANEIVTSKLGFLKRELLESLQELQPHTLELRTYLFKAGNKIDVMEFTRPLLSLGKGSSGSVASTTSSIVEKEGKDKDHKSNKEHQKSGGARAVTLTSDTFDDASIDPKHSKHSKHADYLSGEPVTVTAPPGPSSTYIAFGRFFESLSNLLNVCDMDIAYASVRLFHDLSTDTSMRDLLATYTPVPKLSKNLLSSSAEVRQWSSQTLTFFGMDTFFYQRPVETFESFDVRKSAPTHLEHSDSEVLQFLYQVNALHTLDPEFIEHATTDQMYWFLPLVFQTLQSSRITKEGSHANATLRATINLLLQKLQPLSYLRQFSLWLKISALVDEKEFDLEWAISTRFESTRAFFASLAALMPTVEVGKRYTDLDIVDPMHDVDGHNLPIGAVTVLKVFASKAKPCLLELFPADSKYPSRRVIFKKGDDLRQDLLVQACFYLFNVLWLHSDVEDKPFIHQYRLIPMGPDTGCVEFVQDSESLQTFSFASSWPKYTEEDKSTLLRSAAGSYVAGWVMGVRDRHQDNMMVQHGNMFFHIDLGHIFNEKPTIDAPRFSIPTDLKESMNAQEWERFKDLCANGFKVLHRHAGLLINLICIMFKGVVEDTPKVRLFLASPQSLMIGLEEREASDKIRMLIDSGVTSVKKKGKYLIHTIFVGSNAKPSSSSSSSSAAAAAASAASAASASKQMESDVSITTDDLTPSEDVSISSQRSTSPPMNGKASEDDSVEGNEDLKTGKEKTSAPGPTSSSPPPSA